jgi:hypothetical protein
VKQYFSIILVLLVFLGCTNEREYQAELFEPDNISTTAAIEYFPTFTPDGKTVYFVRRNAIWGDFESTAPDVIFVSHFRDAGWTSPQIARFSGEFSDSDPFISTDGKYLFFTSDRPFQGAGENNEDIWMLMVDGDGWGDPIHLNGEINSDGTEYSPVLTNKNRLYFASTREGGSGQGDIYWCDFAEDSCRSVTNIGSTINSATGEWNVFVDPKEEYLIFEASGKIENKDGGDLYISFPENGNWMKPINMELINSDGSDLAARLSHDGKLLFFASQSGKQVDIYSVPINIIDYYKSLNQNR